MTHCPATHRCRPICQTNQRGSRTTVVTLLLILILGAVSGLSDVHTSVAADDASLNTSFGIRAEDHNAAWVSVELAAGQTTSVAVFVGNYSDTRATALTYAADVYSIVNGGMGVGLDGAPVSGATTWLDYERQKLDLKAGTEARVEIAISVPANTPAGEYETALVVQPQVDDLRDEQANPALLMLSRNAMAVAITVPGPRTPALEIGQASASVVSGATEQTISVALHNSGNVRLKPSGHLTLTQQDGTAVGTWPLELGTLYAGRTATLEWVAPTALNAGNYLLSVELADEAQQIQVQGDPQDILIPDIPDPVVADSEITRAASDGGTFAISENTSSARSDASGIPPAAAGIAGILLLLIVGGGAWALGQRSARARARVEQSAPLRGPDA